MIDLSENAVSLLEDRYLRPRDQGFEPPEELFSRVARRIAIADQFYARTTSEVRRTEEAFFDMMAQLDFLPNSPALLNAGSRLGQLSACFVLPIDDSIQGIFSSMKDAAEIHKSGGGTGFSFSRLRSSGSPVQGSRLAAQGPLPYLNLFNEAMGTVEQGGVRRGGNMGILRIDHPDILAFIGCKSRENTLKNFNLSVAVTDTFMQSLEAGGSVKLVDPHTKEVSHISAQEVWEALVSSAHANGEPGVIFIDTINRFNPTPDDPIEATNPCGEQPLLPYESCVLGSINLSRFVKSRGIDYDRLGRQVELAVHFFDNLIDVNNYPLPRLKRMAEANRKIGLGVMGFADMLIALNIPYNSDIALRLASEVMSFIDQAAREASRKLAVERGVFSNFGRSIYAEGPPLRNATRTTLAPTGSISMIGGCSGGIEPLFAVSYRNQSQGGAYWVVNHLFENIARTEGFYSEALMSEIDRHKGSVQEILEVRESVRKLFLTAADLPPEWHVRIQAAFQKHVDNAVSKTVNMPATATTEDVSRLFKLAWDLGCKGITVYREGSRTDQPLSAENSCPTGKCEL